MALSDEEYRKLHDPANPKGEHYQRFRDRYPEEPRQIQRLMRTGNPADAERAKLIDGHILAEYIRTTHADPPVNRVNDWLEKIKKETGEEKLFYCGNYPYQFQLARIALSHNMQRFPEEPKHLQDKDLCVHYCKASPIPSVQVCL